MTKHEFIFSNQRRHRMLRHVTFWIVWCISYNLLFHFPIHVFKGWDINTPPTPNLQKLGIVLFFIKTFFVNSFFGVILSQILLTYTLIYWLLPNFYLKKRNLVISISVTALVLLCFLVVSVGLKYSPLVYNILTGIGGRNPGVRAMAQSSIIDQVTSLPIVLGFALMIKLIKHWWLQKQETEMLAQEKTNAELQLLKAQIHPHFLFNTLNNIYYFTLSHSSKAPEMIKKLSAIMYYILNECNQPLVGLDKEIKMMRDYMALEEIRYGDQMKMSLEVQGELQDKMVAPLLLIPFVENSFKHGTSKTVAPWMSVRVIVENKEILFVAANSRPISNEAATTKGNIGLKNVRKRLQLLYAGAHSLTIDDQPDSFTVTLRLCLSNNINGQRNNEIITTFNSYELA